MDPVTTTQSGMFRPATLQSLLVLLIASILLRQALLALICVLLLLTALMSWLWNRWSLARVSYSRELSHTRAFPDDEVELVIRIANRKPLPVVALDVREMLPSGLTMVDRELALDHEGRPLLQRSTSLRWYEGVVWRYRLRPRKRGAYRIGPAKLEAGDPFGFYNSQQVFEQRTTLLVYPLPLPLSALGLPPEHPIGRLRARQLIRDPLRIVGVRDYHPDDPLKDVHWSATARVGRLQTRVFETTTEQELAVFLDLDSFERYWEGIDEELVERLISATATVAQEGLREGYAVGLYSNGAPTEFEQLVRLPPGRSPAQLERIMETLARLTPYSVTPIARVLRMASGIPWGATILLISAIASEPTQAAVLRLADAGRRVCWLYLGDDSPPVIPGVVVHHAPPRQDYQRRRRPATQAG